MPKKKGNTTNASAIILVDDDQAVGILAEAIAEGLKALLDGEDEMVSVDLNVQVEIKK